MKWSRAIPSLGAMHPMVRLSNLHSLKNINFSFYWRRPLFWALFLFSFFYLFKYIISSKVMDEPLYTIVTLFLLKGFWNVGRPPFFEFYEKWMLSIFIFHYVWICLRLYIWTLFTSSISPLWACGSSTLEITFSSSWVYEWISFYITKIKWILHACLLELVCEWRSFWLSFYSLFKHGDDHVRALNKIVPNNFSSKRWIVVLVWFVHGFVLYTIIICPWSGRIFLRLYPVLCFRRIYLRFIIRLSFLSRKAYEQYILASKDFTRPCLLASRGSFWMNVQKMKDSHTTMYILENTSYIYLKIQTYVNIRP